MLILKSLKDSIGNGKDLNSSNSMEYLLSIKHPQSIMICRQNCEDQTLCSAK